MSDTTVIFHHVQLYVDELKELRVYKEDEERLFKIKNVKEDDKNSTSKRRSAWEKTGPALDPSIFAPQMQDLVDQVMHGLGWRVTGQCDTEDTRSYLLTSEDPAGIKFVVTAKCNANGEPATKRHKGNELDHFSAENVDRFLNSHAGRQGCAVLAFELTEGSIDKIAKKYKAKHPKLLPETPIHEYDGFRILEVYAYYKGEIGQSDVDLGTRLRFVERTGKSKEFLPGLAPVEAKFDGSGGCYFDHWVSNVVSRTGFLETLEDTLDFSIKVDFNAGVVAAGRAQIESTVTGNASGFKTDDAMKSLVDQSQIFLPINNALSEFGHVHFFLEQIGQGIQHLASRVENLTWFIARVNAYREITGKGFTFLNIPPSYYGRLVVSDFSSISNNLANSVMKALIDSKIVEVGGIVKLNVTREEIKALRSSIPASQVAAFDSAADAIASTVIRGIYSNMYKLLRDNLSEEQYLDIVRNKILVDIQDGDILYQIFTCTVLQRNPDDEAPFLEFIERVCSTRKNPDGSDKAITPGCGGFGIRNFLTLFLSIEVSKTMAEMKDALANGDEAGAKKAEKKIAIFTSQLDKANPILTNISDAMTEEGAAQSALDTATTDKARAAAKARLESARQTKEENNDALQKNSTHHSEWMLRVQNDEE